MSSQSQLTVLFLLTITISYIASYNHGLSPFKLRFSQNRFVFKFLATNFSDTVGELTLQRTERVQNFLNLNELNISLQASKDLSTIKAFTVDPKNMHIKIIDRSLLKVGARHFMKVFLYDTYKRYVPTSCTVEIDIMDNMNKYAPKFQKDRYEAQIVENNAPNTLIVKVTATDDLDYGVNSQITYHFVNPNSIPEFQIKSDTGEIFAKKVLNHEETHFYNFSVMALDRGADIRRNSIVEVNVRVLADANKSPRFNKHEYNLTLSENSDVSRRPTVLTAKALDTDNGTNVVYSLAGSLNDRNTFEIEPQTGAVRLVSRLNYNLKSQYRLAIVASDLSQPPRSAYAQLNVNIEPSKPNPPIFSQPFYEFILYENTAVGEFVGCVHAYDKSSQADSSTIVYSIKEGDMPFSIEPANGTILTDGKLVKNYKRYGYEFVVTASLSIGKFKSESAVKIKVKVLDINDLVPEFAQSQYQVNISEVATIGLPLLTLNTKTAGEEDQLEYSIELGNQDNVFSLIKQGNSRAFLSIQQSNLNYKKQSTYELIVKVMDTDGLYSTATIHVNVIPADIYSPRFSKSIYKFSVYENSEINTLIGQIQAQIPSGQDSESLVYRLINTQVQDTDATADFSLNYKTGNLYVATSQLDRETSDTITLTVTANVGKYVDHAVVQITVLDVNDNRPVFTRADYSAKVYQDDAKSTYLLRVEATDKDLNNNGIVRYSIKEPTSKVSIDSSTGVVHLNQPLTADLNITLVAHDSGEPSQSSETSLLIQAVSRAHLAPQFDRPVLEFYLVENMPSNTVVGEIRARDPDMGMNGNIVYKILDNSLFELQPSGEYNSVLLVSKFVSDYDKRSGALIELKVRAYSSALFTDCLVRVHIQNLNEYKPIVPNPVRIIFNNYKNYFLTGNSAFIPVYGANPAENLTFSLLDSVGKQVVDLDSSTGKITFKPILNSNNLINVSFLVGVNDGTHQIITTCELSVLMLSDNLIADSVTLSLSNIDTNTFLDHLYLNFTQTLLSMLPNSKPSNLHIFNLMNSSYGLNLSLSVSYDYEKDLFMSNTILKQIIYSNSDLIERSLHLNQLRIYEDASCGIEPCFNYQNCINNVKVGAHNNEFLHASSIQFRAISIKHDFECKCPAGFTGRNSSVVCDLEINLCYSNPCGNNGMCLSQESSFVCICDAGFTGRFCEFDLKALKCCSPDIDSTMRTTTSGMISTTKMTKMMNSTSENNPQDRCVAVRNPVNFWSAYDTSLITSSNNICKSNSRCKNLILGGIVCDKCGEANGPRADNSFYNQFCELRAKQFPANKQAYLALPGIRNRFRFNVKLTFATRKTNGYLLHNSRLGNRDSDNAYDFISLRIDKGHLVFSYSLGAPEFNEIRVDDITVADGKWRTVTINYKDHKFILELDDDNRAEVDACDMAYNSRANISNGDLIDCFRVEAEYKMPAKCASQIETCYRYFDMNGPLTLGHKTGVDKLWAYEGCISDVYVNERLVDLGTEAIIDHNTEVGCSLKSNQVCRQSHMKKCEKCEKVWDTEVKCDSNNKHHQRNVYGLNSTSFVAFKDIKLDGKTQFLTQFEFRLSELKHFLIDERLTLINLEVYSQKNRQKMATYYLQYDLKLNEVELLDGEEALFKLKIDLEDGFWHQLKIRYFNNRLFIVLNDEIKQSIPFAHHKSYMKPFIGGSPNLETPTGIHGCVRGLDQSLVILRESTNIGKGCPVKPQAPDASTCSKVCYNNATSCSFEGTSVTCQCQPGFKGKYCQFETRNSHSLLNAVNTCPAKWWGTEPGICGPCKCDESKNFSPDCDKTNGQCQCKDKFYKRVNKVTGEATCVPCNCYLEGSESLQCEQMTGQCKCLSGAGITGRRCDQCVSPFAEMVNNGYECRQLSSSECPRAYKFNTWWPRTKFDQIAIAECPKGSVGKAYRMCRETEGWTSHVDLSECRSSQLIDSQLYKWSELLRANSSMLNSYQALQLTEDLNEITRRADEEDELNYEPGYFTHDFAATSKHSLYANDLVVIKNLSTFIIQYEIDNAPSFLYIQDKYFLRNLFATLNRLLNKKYEPKLQQYRKNEHRHLKNQTSHIPSYDLTQLFVTLDRYMSILVQFSQYHSTLNVDIDLDNFKLAMDNIIGQSYSQNKMRMTNFKLITADDSKNKKVAFVSLDSLASNLPSRLMISPSSKPRSQATQQLQYHKDKFIAVSNVLMVNIQHNPVLLNKAKGLLKDSITAIQDEKSLYIVIDFRLSNIFPAAYDDSYKNLKIAPNSNYYCVYLDPETQSWSTRGAKLVAYDYETNTVKCSYDHFSIYAVVTSTNGLSSGPSQPIHFSLASFIVMPVSFFILFACCFILILIKKYATPLVKIYLYLSVNELALQLLFFAGINANSSQTLCKLLAIVQHYLHLTSYLWILIIVLHLYRMLTELRDINKAGSKVPMFYYILALGLPAITVSLTLGIKQDIYTNFSLFSNLYESNSAQTLNNFSHFYLSSVYCWLCITNYHEIFYVFALPLIIIFVCIIILMILCLHECTRTTFKKSDVPIVKQHVISSLSILTFQTLVSVFLLLVIYAASSSNLLREFIIYQHVYVAATLVYAIQLFLILFVFNRTNKENLLKVKKSYSSNKSVLNESLDTSKRNLYKRSPLQASSKVSDSNQEDSNAAININDLGVEVLANINQQVFKANSKYMLDYRNLQQHTNSTTTTTSGTMDNLEDMEYQANYIKQHQYVLDADNQNASNAYMSHLANTTNTESMTNDSEFYSTRYNLNEFNQQQRSGNVRESDVIDVGQILKARNGNNSNNKTYQVAEFDDSDDMMMPVDFTKKRMTTCYDDSQTDPSSDEAMFNQNYIQQFSQNQRQVEAVVNQCFDPDSNGHNSLSRKNQSLSLFWPNRVAECDTSCIDGSLLFSPSRNQQNENNVEMIPGVTKKNVQEVNVNQLSRNLHPNNSYNSNTASNSTSYTTSTSSLVLSNPLEQQQPPVPIVSGTLRKNTLNAAANAVLVLTHTGSATSSDNESGNETRV